MMPCPSVILVNPLTALGTVFLLSYTTLPSTTILAAPVAPSEFHLASDAHCRPDPALLARTPPVARPVRPPGRRTVSVGCGGGIRVSL